MRVGRGIGSGLGKTAGRGQKGPEEPRRASRSRASRAARCRSTCALPKRGFNNIFAKDYAEVNLGAIQKAIDAASSTATATIDRAALKAAGAARGGKDGVRLLGKGELDGQAELHRRRRLQDARTKRSRRPAVPSRSPEIVPAAEKAEGQAPRRRRARAAGGPRVPRKAHTCSPARQEPCALAPLRCPALPGASQPIGPIIERRGA